MRIVDELASFGAALGAMRWVQGCGGTVSLKHDGLLYVKANGARVRDVASNFACVPLALANRGVGGDVVADAEVFALQPRPALDTYCHVLGPRAVARTNALGVLLLACASTAWLDVADAPCALSTSRARTRASRSGSVR
jgi:hypothetical protein